MNTLEFVNAETTALFVGVMVMVVCLGSAWGIMYIAALCVNAIKDRRER